MPPRLHAPVSLAEGAEIELPPGAARHVQVLRLQPGSPVTLFDGRGGEWSAEVMRMGRQSVQVRVGPHDPIARELSLPITLALGVPANERMDTLVEKACELGVAAIQPLMCERSVLRLQGERAAKKVAHWQAVAVAACEQSGRTLVPTIAPVRALSDWLASMDAEPVRDGPARLLLSLREAGALPTTVYSAGCVVLSGPEGGFTEAEESMARQRGFTPLSLGPRVLRADTAPLAVLAHLSLRTTLNDEGSR